MRQHGSCVQSCPPGHYGVRGQHINRCTKGCEAGQWSEWTACTNNGHLCGYRWGTQSRSKETIRKEAEETASCPALSETKRCRMKKRCAGAASSGGSAQRGGADGSRRRLHRVQHGQCSYTFVLPELENCRGAQDQYGSRNALQRDAPSAENPLHKLQHLEHAMENNTQWLQKRYFRSQVQGWLKQLC
ncbi:UNVERIFIED_CONTAM: hypothetical protein FKN15_004992 [Acipenser sinensis]